MLTEGSLLILVASLQLSWGCSPTDIAAWLPQRADKGYWVLCVAQGGKSADVFSHRLSGGEAAEAIRASWHSGGARAALASALQVDSTISFETESETMTFDKQPWALYRPNHEGTPVIVPPGSERNLLEAGVHVLMEGGMWRWPPMHVDYIRRINQHFSLKTLAVRPGA